MQCEEWDDANSELFKESHDEAVHKNSYKSRLYELISASLARQGELYAQHLVSYAVCRMPVISRLRRLSPFGGCAATFAPVGSVSHDSQVAIAPLQHGYHRLTIICASLCSFKLCSLVGLWVLGMVPQFHKRCRTRLSKNKQETDLVSCSFYFPCHTGSSLIFFFLSKVVALSMVME